MKAGGVRILLIDDDPDVIEVVSEFLGAVGYRVDTALTPEQALGLVALHDYDLVLSDQRLPRIPGALLATELIRCQPTLARRIILVTGELEPVATLPVIRKPFDLDAVLMAVEEHLSAA